MVEAPGVAGAARALGLPFAPGGGIGCPVCGSPLRDGRRGAVGFRTDDRGWRCHRCGAGGDALELASWVLFHRPKAGLEASEWRVLFAELAAHGLVPESEGRPGAASARTAHPSAALTASPPPMRPPKVEVEALWAASLPLASCLPGGEWPDPQAASFCCARGLGPLLPVIDALSLARLTPPAAAVRWPGWWPAGRAARWRLLVQAVEVDGQPASLHARAVVCAHPEANPSAPPKTLWPRACGDHRFAAGGLFFANPPARALLRGEGPPPPGLLLCEGLTDWLSASAHAANNGWAVLGGVSGSWAALARAGLPLSLPVVVGMDPDDAGARYHAQIAAALPGRRLVPLWPLRGQSTDGGAHV
jgi:hypothetical protein